MRRFIPALVLVAVGAAASPGLAQGRPSDVTIVHGLPRFTADIYVDGELLLSGFEPKDATDPMSLPPGTYAVEIRDAGAPADSEAVLSADLEVPAGRNLSVVAHLDEGGEPRVSVFDNEVARIPPGRAQLLVRHQAAAPPVDVQANGDPLFTVASGDQVERSLPASTVDLAALSGSDMQVEPTTVELQEGVAYFVYLIGSSEEQTLDFMVQAVAGAQTSPSEVQTGDGGLVRTALTPLWAVLLAMTAVVVLAGSLVRLAGKRPRRV
jgi:Domain of unknown function (DUF4397)